MDKRIEKSALGERMVWQAADWSAFQETVDSTLRSWACIVRRSREYEGMRLQYQQTKKKS